MIIIEGITGVDFRSKCSLCQSQQGPGNIQDKMRAEKAAKLQNLCLLNTKIKNKSKLTSCSIGSVAIKLNVRNKTKLPWIIEYNWGTEPACSAGDVRDAGSIPGLGRSPGRGHGTPLQYSCLKNSMYRRAWKAILQGITKGWTLLSNYHFHTSLRNRIKRIHHKQY